MEYQKLDPEFKAKWTAALRSGEYKQGRSCLRNDDYEYCCLGVACHLAIGDIPKGYYFIPGSEALAESDLPKIPPMLLGSAGVPGLLAQMNDGAGEWAGKPQTFLQIADWIDANL